LHSTDKWTSQPADRFVDLYKAVGGGWQAEALAPEPDRPPAK